MAGITARTARRWALGTAVVVLGAYAIAAKVAPEPAGARVAAPAASIPVVAAHARVGDVGVYSTGLGTVTALKTVTVRTQVDGQLVSVAFKEGQLVRAGELLAQIDPRPFQVQLEQAQALEAKDAATLSNARVDLRRYQALVEQDAVPRQQLDTQVSLVQQLEATVKSNRAQIASAQLNLTYARSRHQASEAVASANRSLELAMNRYVGGVTTYLEVITAQTAALANQITAADVRTRRMTASVLLIKALGGGWTTADLPAADALRRRP